MVFGNVQQNFEPILAVFLGGDRFWSVAYFDKFRRKNNPTFPLKRMRSTLSVGCGQHDFYSRFNVEKLSVLTKATRLRGKTETHKTKPPFFEDKLQQQQTGPVFWRVVLAVRKLGAHYHEEENEGWDAARGEFSMLDQDCPLRCRKSCPRWGVVNLRKTNCNKNKQEPFSPRVGLF